MLELKSKRDPLVKAVKKPMQMFSIRKAYMPNIYLLFLLCSIANAVHKQFFCPDIYPAPRLDLSSSTLGLEIYQVPVLRLMDGSSSTLLEKGQFV